MTDGAPERGLRTGREIRSANGPDLRDLRRLRLVLATRNRWDRGTFIDTVAALLATSRESARDIRWSLEQMLPPAHTTVSFRRLLNTLGKMEQRLAKDVQKSRHRTFGLALCLGITCLLGVFSHFCNQWQSPDLSPSEIWGPPTNAGRRSPGNIGTANDTGTPRGARPNIVSGQPKVDSRPKRKTFESRVGGLVDGTVPDPLPLPLQIAVTAWIGCFLVLWIRRRNLLGPLGKRWHRPPPKPLVPPAHASFSEIMIGDPLPPELSNRELDRLAFQILSQNTPRKSRHNLDLRRTVERTSRRAGCFEAYFRSRRRVQEMVVLEGPRSTETEGLTFGRELAHGLHLRGVQVQYGKVLPERGLWAPLPIPRSDSEPDRPERPASYRALDRRTARSGQKFLVIGDSSTLHLREHHPFLHFLATTPSCWLELREQRSADQRARAIGDAGGCFLPAASEALLGHLQKPPRGPTHIPTSGFPGYGGWFEITSEFLERHLGLAWHWAQTCAMVKQPISLALIETIRRGLYPGVERRAITRIQSLPGVMHHGLSISLPIPVLAVLRQDFRNEEIRSKEDQVEALDFLLRKFEECEPPAEALLGHALWRFGYHRLKLERFPNRNAAEELYKLKFVLKGILSQAVSEEFAQVRHNDASPYSIPLRIWPTSPDVLRCLDALHPSCLDAAERKKLQDLSRAQWIRASAAYAGILSLSYLTISPQRFTWKEVPYFYRIEAALHPSPPDFPPAFWVRYRPPPPPLPPPPDPEEEVVEVVEVPLSQSAPKAIPTLTFTINLATEGEITAAAVAPPQKELVIATSDGFLHIVQQGQAIASVSRRLPQSIDYLETFQAQKVLAGTGVDRGFFQWPVFPFPYLFTEPFFTETSEHVEAFDLSADGRQIVFGTRSRKIRLLTFDAEGRSTTKEVGSAPAPIAGLDFSRDGKFVLATYFTSGVALWEPGTSRLLKTRRIGGVMTAGHTLRDGYVVGNNRGRLTFLDASFEPDGEIETGTSIRSISSHPTDDILITQHQDQSLRFWQTTRRQEVTTSLFPSSPRGELMAIDWDRNLLFTAAGKTLEATLFYPDASLEPSDQ